MAHERGRDPPPANGLTARQRGSSIGFLAGSAAGRFAQVVAHAVMARTLGADGFGLYAIGWTLLQLGQSIGHLGLSEGVIGYLPRHLGGSGWQVRAILRFALGLSVVAGLVLALLLVLGRNLIAAGVFGKPDLSEVLLAMAPALAVAPAMQVAAAATRATTTVRYSVLTVDAGLPFLLLLAASALWLAGAGVVAMALATSTVFVIVAGGAGVLVARLFRGDVAGAQPHPVWSAPPEGLLAFSLSALSMSATMLLMLWSDRLFVGAFRPSAEVGAYHAASQISMLFVIVFQPLAAVLAPFAAGAAWAAQHEALKEAYQNLYRWGLVLALPGAAIALEFAQDLLILVYGPEFAIAAPPARVLIAGQLAYLIGGGAGALLVMTGRQQLWLVHASSAVLINLALNALLVPRLGMMGAAIATAIAFAILLGGGCLVVRSALGIWPLTRPLAISLLGAAAAYLALALALHSAEGAPERWLRALPAVASAVVLFLLALRAEALRHDLRWLWRRVRHRR